MNEIQNLLNCIKNQGGKTIIIFPHKQLGVNNKTKCHNIYNEKFSHDDIQFAYKTGLIEILNYLGNTGREYGLTEIGYNEIDKTTK